MQYIIDQISYNLHSSLLSFFSENDCNWLNNLQVILGKCAHICRKFQFNHKTTCTCTCRRWEPWCWILCLGEMTEFWLPELGRNYFLSKYYRYQVSIGSSSDIDLLLEREKNYKQAIENANKAGEGSKARRYGRGLKVLQSLQFAAICTSFSAKHFYLRFPLSFKCQSRCLKFWRINIFLIQLHVFLWW